MTSRDTVWVALIALAVLVPLVAVDAFRRADLLLYDRAVRQLARAPRADIVIVSVDEASLQALGRWPWSRKVHAQLLDTLTRHGARAVAFDVLFTEAETADPEADRAFAAAIARHGRVVLPVAPLQAPGELPSGELLPLPALQAAAAGLGHVDVHLEEDAVARGAVLVAGVPGAERLTLALAAARVAGYETRAPEPAVPPTSTATWARWQELLVPFVGPPGTFATLPCIAVLSDDGVAAVVRDKIVLVGATAAGVAPALATPVSARARPMPGVEYNANVLQALLDGRWITPAPRWQLLGLTAAILLLPLLAYARLSARAMLFASVVGLAGLLLLAHLLLRYHGLWFAPAAALVGLVLVHALWSWRRVEQHRRELLLQLETDRATLAAVGDAVVRTDREGRVRFLNPVAVSLASVDAAAAIGRRLTEVFLPAGAEDRERIDAMISGALADGATRSGVQCAVRDRDENRRTVQLSAGVVHGPSGESAGLVFALSDVTAVASLTEALAHQAMHDDLTRLPNRRLLLDRLEQALRLAERNHERVAVLFADLDGFKRINESLGHLAGDRVLQEVGARLSATRRAGDTVARWGGDEFVILLGGLRREMSVGRLARQTLAALSSPLQHEGSELCVTATMGIAMYPGDGTDAATLLRHADLAMYRAKRALRGGVQFYSDKAQEFTARHLALEQALRYAVRRGELELYYQPQLCCATDRITGVEALLRWHHPESGLMSPGAFIPVAEETDLIEEIGLWTLREACAQARIWAALGFSITTSINVSPRQMQRPNVVRNLERVLRESRVSPHLLKLEIVETAVVHDLERLAGTLRAARELGVQVSIDDFGTGYSSLTHLKRFPVDEVKIDRSFVHGIGADTNDAAITAGVIAMAHSLSLSVVAEGVENEAQLGFLRERGCDEWQGFLCSRPVPAAELTARLGAARETPQAAGEAVPGVGGV